MRGINKVILMGNATRDAELRHTTTGKPVSSIRLATNRKVRTAAGEVREDTQYHSVVCWDGLAETTARYVEGRLDYRTYTDSDGAPRGTVEIVAADVQFLGGRAGARTDAAEPAPDAVEDVDLDSIPVYQ